MKGYIEALAGCVLWIHAAAAMSHAPQGFVTAIHSINLSVRQAVELQDSNELGTVPLVVAAVVPTESGQIGINPPGTVPTPANIGKNTQYLTEENGSTEWIGTSTKTTTTTDKSGQTGAATITKGVVAHKNDLGGLDILLTPAVKAKLEEIAGQVTPCAAKKRRRQLGKRGEACGLADFVRRVGADQELRDSFARPLTDQVWHEVDSGYGSDDPSVDPGWEGDGDGVGHEDPSDGYFSNDDEGFYEGASDGEAAETVEAVVFSSEEEAAAIAASLSGADAAAAAAVWGGSTITAAGFLSWLWGNLKDKKPVPLLNEIPKESIHKITKTKTKTQTSTSSSSSSSSSGCPTQTDKPLPCDKGCKPTSVQPDKPQPTGVVFWQCSDGQSKGCSCDPGFENRLSILNVNFDQAVLDAVKGIDVGPKDPKTDCPGAITNVPSQFFVDETSKHFCELVMKDLNTNVPPAGVAYDIHGNNIPILKSKLAAAPEAKRELQERSPPEKADNYLDYKFFLGYEHEDGECLVPKDDLCKNAWTKLVQSPCGSNHGSAGDRMFVDASIDVGCGKFTWHVEQPPPPPPPSKPTLGQRVCHDAFDHEAVNDEIQKVWSENGCDWYGNTTMKEGDKEITWNPKYAYPPIIVPDTHQIYKISWIGGCKGPEQDVFHPIPDDQGTNCVTIMTANYKKCDNNGGAGGSTSVGCLNYDFYVSP